MDISIILHFDKPVGFYETSSALVDLYNELDEVEETESNTVALSRVMNKVESYLSACSVILARCPTIFDKLHEMMLNETDHKNLLPYLKECNRRQRKYCPKPKKQKQKKEQKIGDNPNSKRKRAKDFVTSCWPSCSRKQVTP